MKHSKRNKKLGASIGSTHFWLFFSSPQFHRRCRRRRRRFTYRSRGKKNIISKMVEQQTKRKADLKMSIKYLNYEDFLFLIFSQLKLLLRVNVVSS